MKSDPKRSTLCHRAPGSEKPASAAAAPSRVAPKRSATANASAALETLCAPGRTSAITSASHRGDGSAATSSPRHIERRMPILSLADDTTPKSRALSRRTPFSLAMPSLSPKNSMCAVPMFVTSPASGLATSQRCAISPGWFVPISSTRKSASSGVLRIVTGRPRWLLKFSAVAWTVPTPERNAFRSSFVVVFPADPVTPTTFARSASLRALAYSSSSP